MRKSTGLKYCVSGVIDEMIQLFGMGEETKRVLPDYPVIKKEITLNTYPVKPMTKNKEALI